jgi:hypothetical protein
VTGIALHPDLEHCVQTLARRTHAELTRRLLDAGADRARVRVRTITAGVPLSSLDDERRSKPPCPRVSTMLQVNSGLSPCRSVTVCTVVPAHIGLLPFAMKIFEPLMRQPPSTFSATVCEPRESEPAFGSVRPKAQSASPEQRRGRYFLRCASVPKSALPAPRTRGAQA